VVIVGGDTPTKSDSSTNDIICNNIDYVYFSNSTTTMTCFGSVYTNYKRCMLIPIIIDGITIEMLECDNNNNNKHDLKILYDVNDQQCH
jgi:hypothetical protein